LDFGSAGQYGSAKAADTSQFSWIQKGIKWDCTRQTKARFDNSLNIVGQNHLKRTKFHGQDVCLRTLKKGRWIEYNLKTFLNLFSVI